MPIPLRKSFHEEIFRSPKDQRVPVEIVSTEPLAVEVRQLAEFVVPIAQAHGFIPMSSGEQVQPLAGWEELEGQLEFWMARSTDGSLTYLHVTGEAGDDGMQFRPEAGLRLQGVKPAAPAYSKGPGSSLASTSL